MIEALMSVITVAGLLVGIGLMVLAGVLLFYGIGLAYSNLVSDYNNWRHEESLRKAKRRKQRGE